MANGAHITYVGTDGQIYIVGLEGAEPQRISDPASGNGGQEARYTWPTWSPDGEVIAYSQGYVAPQGPVFALQARQLATDQSFQVHQDSSGSAGLVGAGAPHYTLWSPDSQWLSFLANRDGLKLFVNDPREGSATQPVSQGAPSYYSWAPDSQSLLIHLGEELYLHRPEQGQFPQFLDLPPSLSYRAPSWSPDGHHIAFVGEIDGVQRLSIATTDGSELRPLAAAPDQSAFIWSPAGNVIALASGRNLEVPFYEGVQLVNVETGQSEELGEGPAIAFFWSPDGSSLAIVRLAAGGQRLAWEIVDTETGTSRTLVEFIPSQDLFFLLTYFGQYAYSHRLWSPDGTHLVFTGAVLQARAALPDQSQVYVVDVSGETSPRTIGEGSMAFWSGY